MTDPSQQTVTDQSFQQAKERLRAALRDDYGSLPAIATVEVSAADLSCLISHTDEAEWRWGLERCAVLLDQINEIIASGRARGVTTNAIACVVLTAVLFYAQPPKAPSDGK